MYFHKKQGKQVLDLRGDLVLTHNKSLVKSRCKSAAPASVKNAQYVQDITRMRFFHKVIATFNVIGFIWGESQEFKADEE